MIEQPLRNAIYDLLEEAFDQKALDVLAFKLFPVVSQDLPTGTARSKKIQTIIDYAERNGRIPDLLDYVKQENPVAYKNFEEKTKSLAKPEPSTTPILTPPTVNGTNSQLFLSAIIGTLVVVVITALVMRFILEVQNVWWFVLVLGIEFPFILVIIGKLTGQDFLAWLKSLLVNSGKEGDNVRKQ